MTVESASYIHQLNASYPSATDTAYEGDDHIRLLKTCVKGSFPSLTGPVLVSDTVLNYLSGLNSNIMTLLAAKAPLASPVLSGTPVAPTAGAATNTTQIATTAFVQAQKASPVFTGTPTAPTPTTGDNSQKIATTQFVQSAVVEATGGVSRGKAYFFGAFN